jgi:hypothetical protein
MIASYPRLIIIFKRSEPHLYQTPGKIQPITPATRKSHMLRTFFLSRCHNHEKVRRRVLFTVKKVG